MSVAFLDGAVGRNVIKKKKKKTFIEVFQSSLIIKYSANIGL